MSTRHARRPSFTRNGIVAGACVAFVAGMVGLAYASVPLYRLFCQVTGYGGTTQVSVAGSAQTIDRVMKIRFDANMQPDLSWDFEPEQLELELKVGETALAFYRAASHSAVRTSGSATFNVTPLEVGKYFNKIDCFCFTEQSLDPGQTVDMPVSFFVDPSIDDDPNLAHVTTITLSYTFYAVEGEDEGESVTVPVTDSRIN